ncbi:MAG: hypothetical protein QW692_01815 [Nitrososphaerota archaeon]
MRRRAEARRIIAILLLAAIISIAAAYAASYPVSWSRPLDLYALWSVSLPFTAIHSKTLGFTASWLAQTNPYAALSRQLALTVLWDAGYAITSPKPLSLRLIDLAAWRILVEKAIPDYLGRWRLFSISASPLLKFGKEFFDGSVSIYTTGVVEMFYNSSREPVVYGGSVEKVEGGYLIRGGPGTIRIHDKARCAVSVMDNKGMPYGAVQVYMNGTAVPRDEWFDCPNGAFYEFKVEGRKISRIHVNGEKSPFIPGLAYLSNSTTYKVDVVVKVPAMLRIDSVNATRIDGNRIKISVSGAAIDLRHGSGIPGAHVFFRVDGRAVGGTVTSSDGTFNATIIPIALYPPSVDVTVKIEAELSHEDYDPVAASATATAKAAAKVSAAVPTELIIALAAIGGAIAALAAIGKKRAHMLRAEEEKRAIRPA